MKSLKPTMRENKRYLLVRGKISEVEKVIYDFIGVLGMSKCGLQWIKRGENSAVLAVNRAAVNEVRASFAAWPEEIRVLRVSGTLKGLRR